MRARRIGDLICTTPALRALREALPEAEISLVGLPFVRELVERSPYLNRLIEFPGYPGMAEQLFDPRRAVPFFSDMQSERFDLAIQMHGSGVYSNPFALMLGARTTAGFVRQGDEPGLLDAALPYPEKMHERDKPLALATFLGAPFAGRETEFALLPGDHREAEGLLNHATNPLIGLSPSARDTYKRWSPESFASVGCALQSRVGGTVVVLGDENGQAVAEAVARSIPGPCINLAGHTSLGSLGAVISRLDVLVTNDSAPAQIAYALGTRSVTLFTETDPTEWGPLDESKHAVVVGREVAVERVIVAACRVLRAGQPVPYLQGVFPI